MTRIKWRALVCASLASIPLSSHCFAGLLDGLAAAVNPSAIKPDTTLTSCDGVETVQGGEADLQTAKDDATKRAAWCSQPNINNPPNAQCTTQLEGLRQRRNGIQCFLEQNRKVAADGDDCEKNAYRDCYRGVKWGTVIDSSLRQKICPALGNVVLDPDASSPAVEPCERFFDSGYRNIMNKFYVGSASCPLITLDNKLVGFKFEKSKDEAQSTSHNEMNAMMEAGVTDDEILYLISKLKSKYGKDAKKESCQAQDQTEATPVYAWSNSNGLQIQTRQASNGNVTVVDGKTVHKSNFFVRYLHIDTIKSIAAELNGKATKAQSQAEDKKVQSLGQGL